MHLILFALGPSESSNCGTFQPRISWFSENPFFFKHIVLPYPWSYFVMLIPLWDFLLQVKSAQKLQGVITLYFTRSRCRNGIGECEGQPGNLWYMYPCCRWNVWQNYYQCVSTGFLEHFCFLVMVFHQLSTCTSTLTLIQVGIFQDQCGKLSFIWMDEQCAFGTSSFHI